MNHPSIGGKEREPQSRGVPEGLLRAISAVLLPGQRFEWWWNLGSLSLRAVLDSIPSGWMKTEQGWIQMEPVCIDWGQEIAEPDLYPDYDADQLYRVKQPSEDHPAGL